MKPLLYKIGTTLELVKEKPFAKERELQKLFEANMSLITGFDLIKSEFTIKNKRIDTLAFDNESKGFVIIEYKKDKNSSVVDQGFTYLSLMLQNKADFILEYNEVHPRKTLSRTDIDWSQSRVIFVASDFTDNQIEATNFKDIAIELYEVKRLGEHLIVVPIKKSRAAESIKPIAQKNKEYKNVTDEIKVYTEEDFLSKKSDEVVSLYEKYKTAIINLAEDIEVKPQKLYIAFKKDNRNICDIQLQGNGLKMTINVKAGILDDTKKLTRDMTGKGHWGVGDYEIKITNDKDLEYIMSLVKQALI